ncbi:UHRF1-binding protein 1-like protein [Corchorus capsularis]|uniref:UHRF1-binding protein 1-like protein n=1 Tax=Corchorus capsularis TaxID=210143 RepID=A0A1R3ID97_COCAP|nr:UHRF1-binding protein 1-like protein [Corchorus capsularis]
MESILARALEYTLKYWLKSFSRDQFKLQGRTVQLSNLDINGDALHASMGLPPALNVTTAKVGKLEIILPYVSNVQVEPIVVQIDRLDLVLEENPDVDSPRSSSSTQSSTSSGKGSGYGFADKIADGMTVQVQTVNLLLETRGGARGEGGAAWASPMASITMRKLVLYTTNENWQVVNLKEARDFSSNKKFIYVFKKLEWESLSIDLLPHPDMFSDANLARFQVGANQRDDDGAKRVFFGGERFLEGISGEAYITVQRTELNSPLGLEVQLHVTEAVCPALSEPGLRALLRFLTGLYVCLNRGDVDLKAQQRSVEAAGRSLVSVVVDHIFLCIKDTEFQLELLMQSLLFSRASVSDGENAQNLSKVMIGGLFLRDTFSRPPCTLVQPSMTAVADSSLHIPDFATNFCPPIYPLGEQQWQLTVGVPLICLHSLQVKPSPLPPSFASQTVIGCQPLMIHLQEESCLRISSFLADGIVVNRGAILPDSSVNSLVFALKELDISVPLDTSKLDNHVSGDNHIMQKSFAGARLHIEKLFFSESPSLKLKQLNLEKDPACFLLWDGQPIDASQKKWTAGASEFSLSLETTASLTGLQSSHGGTSGLWRSVELKDASIEVAMVSADGSPLTVVPPPGGVVRIGIACQQFMSNTSVEQLFFVLDLYAYIGMVSEKIAVVGKNKRPKRNRDESLGGSLMEKVPSDTAVSLAVNVLQLRFLESSSLDIQGTPLVQFIGNTLFLKVTHRTLGGAIVVSSTLCWESVQVDCVDTEGNLVHKNGMLLDTVENGSLVTNGFSPLRAVFWVNNKQKQHSNGKASLIPFLDISIVHVIPFDERDKECHSLSVSACISGVRLGGGMNYTEALLHRFGIIGPDGGPSMELSKGLENLSSGPLSKLLKPSAFLNNDLEDGGTLGGAKNDSLLHLEMPDDVDVSIELQDWLFALEGVQEMAENWWFDKEVSSREQRCWHTTFRSLQVKAKSSPKDVPNGKGISHGMQRYPVELVTVGVEGLQTLKPQARRGTLQDVSPTNGFKEYFETLGGINLEARMVISEDNIEDEAVNWVVENLKFSVKQPIEAVVTKDELQHLALLCQSEVDSMGRIAVGVLRLLKLEKSLGKETIDKLSNLGTEGFEKIFASDKLGRGSSAGSLGLSPVLKEINEEPRSTVALLEEAVLDSQVKCDALVTELSKSESSQKHLTNINELRNKLDSMQSLLVRLRGQM